MKGLPNRISNIGTARLLKTFHNILSASRSLNVSRMLISFESQISHETRLVLFLVKLKIRTTFSFSRDLPFGFRATVALRCFLMKNTQLRGWIKVYELVFCLGWRKVFAFVPFSKISLTTRFTNVCAHLQFNAESLKDASLPCNWSYTSKPKSSLGFWAVASGNPPCYVDMGLAEKSLDLLGILFKMLCFSHSLLTWVYLLLLTLCYFRKEWPWEQCLSCCFWNCDYHIIVTLLLFHPFRTYCFVYMHCIPYKCLLQLKARSKIRWPKPHHNLQFFIFGVTWSICLLTRFHPRTEVFLNCSPLLQIHTKQFTLLSAPEKNKLCYILIC